MTKDLLWKYFMLIINFYKQDSFCLEAISHRLTMLNVFVFSFFIFSIWFTFVPFLRSFQSQYRILHFSLPLYVFNVTTFRGNAWIGNQYYWKNIWSSEFNLYFCDSCVYLSCDVTWKRHIQNSKYGKNLTWICFQYLFDVFHDFILAFLSKFRSHWGLWWAQWVGQSKWASPPWL